MQIIEFCNLIAGTLNRSVAAFTSGGVNHIIVAANNAKREAEKLLDFELLKCSAEVAVDLQDGGELSAAVLTGTATPVKVNRVLRGYIEFNGGGGPRPADIVTRETMYRRYKLRWDDVQPWQQWIGDNTAFLPSTPLIFRFGTKMYVWPGSTSGFVDPMTIVMDVVRRSEDYKYQRKVNFQVTAGGPGNIDVAAYELTEDGSINGQSTYSTIDTNAYYNATYPGNQFAFQHTRLSFNESVNRWMATRTGRKSDATPIDFPMFRVTLGVNAMLGQYSEETTLNGSATVTNLDPTTVSEDFLIDDCLDWIQLKVLKALNFYLKDDRRLNISQRDIDTAWAGVVAWNSSLGSNSDSEGITLD